jgi:hypothetical protein
MMDLDDYEQAVLRNAVAATPKAEEPEGWRDEAAERLRFLDARIAKIKSKGNWVESR